MRQLNNAGSNLQPPADGSPRAGDFTHFSPWRFLMITIGGIFLAEVVAMAVLLNFRTWPYLLQTLLDATIMVLMIFPLIYYFSLRPLLIQIRKRQQAETDLKAAYEEMELRVQKRTEELRVANFDLEEEINVRTQAENALRQSEQRLSRAQEIAHLGSWELDLLTDQLTWSDEVYRIFGLQPQEFAATYKAFLEAVHPDDRVAVDNAYAGSLRENLDSYEIEHRIVKRCSGEVRSVHEKCEHFRDESGQIIRSAGMVHDVTERKQSEESLRQSEEKFRSAFAHAAIGFAMTTPDGRFIDANPAYCVLTGYEIEELQSMEFSSMIHAHDHADNMKLIDQMLAGQITDFVVENRYRRKDGESVWVRKSVSLVRDRAGVPHWIIALVEDITQRKRVEEALHAAHDELERRVLERTEELAIANRELLKEIRERERVEQQLRIQTTAMEAAANGMVITNQQGIIQWTNPALTLMSGYEAQDLVGQSTQLFNSGRHDPDFYQQLWGTICAGSVWHGELTNRRKDGSLYIEEQTITPVRNGSDQISHFIAIKQDVTERKLIYAQLEESNRELTTISISERQQRKVAEILSQASVALSQTLDIQRVMATILDYVERVLPVDAALLILSEGDEQYRIRGVRASKAQGQVMNLLNQSIDLLNEPIVKPFFEKETSTLLRDAQGLELWNGLAELASLRTWLGIPLISTGKTLGMVVAANLQADFFTDDQVELAEAVVSQATVALQNAWLFEQVRAGRQRLQMLSRHLVEIQENERKFIARELHDETSQALTSLKLGLHSIEQFTDRESTIGKQIANLKTLADEILESLHRLAINLRPASLDHLGLVEALTSLVQSTGERSALFARFKCLGTDHRNRLTEDIESSVYRIVQESLTNIVRHAKATCADVILEWQDEQIMVIVEDDGIGIDLTSARASGRLGLVGMQERAEMLGGKFLIESNPDAGTTLVVEIPYAH